MPEAKTKESEQKLVQAKHHSQFDALKAFLRKNRAFKFFLLWLAPFLILMSFLFSSVLGNYNYLEIFPKTLIFPTLMNAFSALLIALIIFWLNRPTNIGTKLVSAAFLGLLMVNYDGRFSAFSGLIKAILPLLPKNNSDQIVSLIFILLLVCICVGIGRLVEFAQPNNINLRPLNIAVGVYIFIGILFVGQSLRLVKILPIMIQESRVEAPSFGEAGSPTGQQDQVMPDIFYIVLDRYTNAEVLKNQFNFDNGDFTTYLRNNDFTVNDTARSNYPYTTISISSTINANYTNDMVAPYKYASVQSRTLYHNLIRQSSVIKALKEKGYSYESVGSVYGASNKAPLADADHWFGYELTTASGKEIKRLRGIESSQFLQSPFYRFSLLSGIKWWPIKLIGNANFSVENVRDQLNKLDHLTTEEEPGSRFIFAHILVPHEPFSFNADGSLSTYTGTDDVGRPIKEKYVNQIQFINSQMQELVDKIQKQSDGKAVIIINADEGPYPQFMNYSFENPTPPGDATDEIINNGDMRDWSDDWLNMKFGILQAAHIPKATAEDLQNLSSVNIFRIILDRYAGYSLPLLPDCHFGLTQGALAEYKYADITKRFLPNANAICQTKQSLSNF